MNSPPIDKDDDKDFEQFIINRITQLRMAKDVSEYQMSLDLGQSKGYINNITTGRSMPLMSGFKKICDYFDITPAEFFDANFSNPPLEKEIIHEIDRLFHDNLPEIKQILNKMEPEEVRAFFYFIKKIQNSK